MVIFSITSHYILLLIQNLLFLNSASTKSSILSNEFAWMPTVDLSELLCEVVRSSFTWSAQLYWTNSSRQQTTAQRFKVKDLDIGPEHLT